MIARTERDDIASARRTGNYLIVFWKLKRARAGNLCATPGRVALWEIAAGAVTHGHADRNIKKYILIWLHTVLGIGAGSIT